MWVIFCEAAVGNCSPNCYCILGKVAYRFGTSWWLPNIVRSLPQTATLPWQVSGSNGDPKEQNRRKKKIYFYLFLLREDNLAEDELRQCCICVTDFTYRMRHIFNRKYKTKENVLLVVLFMSRAYVLEFLVYKHVKCFG